MCTKRFTLMELLVVITVIAILASMLLPALGKAKEKSRRVICMSNLKQMGNTTMFYSNDFNGVTPPWNPDGNDPWNSGSRNLRERGQTRALGHLLEQNYISVANAKGVFWCPSRKKGVKYSVDGIFGWEYWSAGATTGYSYQHRRKRRLADCGPEDAFGGDLAIQDNFTMNGKTYSATSVGQWITHGGKYYNAQFFDMSVRPIIDEDKEFDVGNYYNSPQNVLNKFEDLDD